MGGGLGFGGTLKPGMGALFLDRMGEGGLLRGYAACMFVEMWVSERCKKTETERRVNELITTGRPPIVNSGFIHAQSSRRAGDSTAAQRLYTTT